MHLTAQYAVTMSYVLRIIQTQNALTCGNHFPVAQSGFGKGGGGVAIGGLEAKSPAANEFLWLSHKKILILAHFFIEKGRAVSVVTMDNAKIFSQLMSKSRSLGKISDRRLQPLFI